jgi:predicted patatin/cPLA2 family phospholipase
MDEQYELYKELSQRIIDKNNEVESLEQKVKTLREAKELFGSRPPHSIKNVY